jgi:hypothetical protein
MNPDPVAAEFMVADIVVEGITGLFREAGQHMTAR